MSGGKIWVIEGKVSASGVSDLNVLAREWVALPIAAIAIYGNQVGPSRLRNDWNLY